MRIDGLRTRQAIRSSGRTVAGYARVKHFDPIRFQHVLSNNCLANEAELTALREDGILVMAEEEQEAA